MGGRGQAVAGWRLGGGIGEGEGGDFCVSFGFMYSFLLIVLGLACRDFVGVLTNLRGVA